MTKIDQGVWAPVVAVCAIAAATTLCMIGWPTMGGTDGLAAWAQTLLAGVAIGVAIYVPWKQRNNEEKTEVVRAKERQRRLLLAIQDEVKVTSERYREKIGCYVEIIEEGKPFDFKGFFVPDPFPVYRNLVHDIGIITDDRLRQAIIRTYSAGAGLVSAVHRNNEMFDESRRLDVAAIHSEYKIDGELAAKARAWRITFASGLKTNHRETMDEVDELLALLTKALDELGRESPPALMTTQPART